jgi:hypothetical protein
MLLPQIRIEQLVKEAKGHNPAYIARRISQNEIAMEIVQQRAQDVNRRIRSLREKHEIVVAEMQCILDERVTSLEVELKSIQEDCFHNHENDICITCGKVLQR